MELVLLCTFLGLTFLGVPVAYALALSVSVILYHYMHIPQVMVRNNFV